MSRLLVVAGVVILALGVAGLIFPGEDEDRGGTLVRPIDPSQQTAVAFGQRSHWLQPWRGYLDTWPATRLRDAIGINFNVAPGEAPATARLLARSGVRRARVEFGWDSMAYSDPRRLRDPARLRTMLAALRDNGIRPLILLNAHHGAPGPTRFFTAALRAPAPRGARRVLLSRSTARRVVPGRTGLNGPGGKAADVLFTAVRRNGVARLSKPLPRALRAGRHRAATLRYRPFSPPRLRGGRRNPAFERTLRGWLLYVGAVTRSARDALGGEDFDVEIWNELSFGSDFLYRSRYYDPPRVRGRGDVTRAILKRTVTYLRDPRHGVSRIGIGNGFANQTPFPAGSTSPRGLTAIDKHPYYGFRRFPDHALLDGIAPLDALGRPDFEQRSSDDGSPLRRDRYIPTYDAFFPEFILNAIQTEHLIRDVSPITTRVYRTAHGRATHPAGGRPPKVWVTETNLDPTGADPSKPGGPRGLVADLTPADVAHLHAKAALRYFTAFVGKGVSAVYLYAVKGRNLALVDPSFFTQLRASGGAYPGDAAGGETPRALGRLAGALEGAEHIPRTRPLSLLAISDRHGHKQFDGDGSAAHPQLYDRDVVAFFPYQLDESRYVAAVYVMTRNLAKPLSPASFRLSIGGLDGLRTSASATDPLTGERVQAKIVSRATDRLVVEIPLTDSPRLLTLEERG